MTHDPAAYTVVVPTVGRDSLETLLAALTAQPAFEPAELIVVDDRPTSGANRPISLPAAETSRFDARVVAGHGRGPAAARNLGWRLSRTAWIVFLDDDVVPDEDWAAGLSEDLAAAGPDVAGIQGVVEVPIPARPTDWERNTAGLARSAWITADMAYRRDALERVSGFDERFPRAYREDADLALRVRQAGWTLQRGRRRVRHPARVAGWWASVAAQQGNSSDALMRHLHGPDWRSRAEAPAGRLRRHLLTVGALAAAFGGGSARHTRAGRLLSLAGAVGWTVLTAEFALARILPGPRTPREIGIMTSTSVIIPVAAVWCRATGWWRFRAAQPWPEPVRAVLFDRDGTLIRDDFLPADPARVEPMPHADEAVRQLRRRGIAVGVVTNQAAVGDGRITLEHLRTRNQKVDDVLGPFATWQVCIHSADAGCGCRKPAPGMIRAAAEQLGVHPSQCAVIGDTVADVVAARAAGARGVLVPNSATAEEDLQNSPLVAADLAAAVRMLLPEAAP